MFDFIPIEYYTPIYYNVILIIVFFTFIRLQTKGYTIQNPRASFVLLLAVTLYMGLRPVSFVFVDMGTYNAIFEAYASGSIEILLEYDILWQLFLKTCSDIMTAQLFFLLCAILYVVPLYKASKNWLGEDRFVLFLMFVASFSFWSYGTNGIRNGIATSIFVLAVSFTNKRYLSYSLLVISYLIHASTIIPIAAYVLTLLYKNPKHYLIGWLLCIPLSLAFGGVFETFFTALGFEEDRISYLIEGNVNNDSFAYVGFRWDFVIYSASAVFFGYYFIIKRKFNDKIYNQLFSIY